MKLHGVSVSLRISGTTRRRLGLATLNHGALATFDRTFPLKGVTGATAGDLKVIGR